jgi:hypothetical protein
MLNCDDVAFRHDPFPIGVARQLFAPDPHRELCATFPDELLLMPAWREFRLRGAR